MIFLFLHFYSKTVVGIPLPSYFFVFECDVFILLVFVSIPIILTMRIHK
ncbi:hypothetical protein HMPREF9419_1767 [Prevotella nigrescens ATCC 33563]|nr:hypothetical protein HMPREF9419_1767 [Prevotella nigrescens ATCC 33563]